MWPSKGEGRRIGRERRCVRRGDKRNQRRREREGYWHDKGLKKK